jgi:curli biogenesis system outer membrane secretion channel CsgG
MYTKILAVAALLLAAGLAGCATTGSGTTTYATTAPIVVAPAPTVANDGSGNVYRVYPGDEDLTPSDIGG